MMFDNNDHLISTGGNYNISDIPFLILYISELLNIIALVYATGNFPHISVNILQNISSVIDKNKHLKGYFTN